MTLPSPAKDHYWRNRILTGDEYAETIAAAKAIIANDQERAKTHAETVKVFLKEMEGMGHSRSSAEYKYVSSRVGYRPKFSQTLIYNIETAQRNLRKNEDDTKRQEAEAERQRERMVKLAEQAKELGIDPFTHFGDERGLRLAVRAAREVKLVALLDTAPYYVKASFYGHCLRGDWSEGRRSYGCRELRDLDIPATDTEHPELHALAKGLKEDAGDWEGDDGRYFRETYQRLDALLSEEDAKLLEFLDSTHVNLYYSKG